MPGKAGSAHKIQCSEIWTASLRDLHRLRGVLQTAMPFKHTKSERMKHYPYHCTSSTSSSSRQCKKSSRETESADTVFKLSILRWRNTTTSFTERLQLIYRFPGGNILLDKREYFVALVKRKAVQYVSQQQEGSCGRTDTYMKRVKS